MNRIQQGCTVGQGKSFPYSARRKPVSSAAILTLGARVHKRGAAVAAPLTMFRKTNELIPKYPFIYNIPYNLPIHPKVSAVSPQYLHP